MKNLEKLGVRTEDLQLEELTIEDLPPELDRVMTEEPVSSLQNHIGFFLIFLKKSFRNTIRVSNSFGLDQGRQNIGPEMNLNCFQNVISR